MRVAVVVAVGSASDSSQPQQCHLLLPHLSLPLLNRAAPSSRTQVCCALDINIGSVKNNYSSSSSRIQMENNREMARVVQHEVKKIVGRTVEIVVEVL